MVPVRIAVGIGSCDAAGASTCRSRCARRRRASAKSGPVFVPERRLLLAAIAALAAGDHVLAKSGRVLTTTELAREYGFTDLVDGAARRGSPPARRRLCRRLARLDATRANESQRPRAPRRRSRRSFSDELVGRVLDDLIKGVTVRAIEYPRDVDTQPAARLDHRGR